MQDWKGGTRIASCLDDFNRHWARRLLGANAALLLVTDGLDRDEHGELTRAAAQLRLFAHQIVWLNPLLRFDRFEPRAAGVRALLPHVDRFLPVHNLASLADLATRAARAGADAALASRLSENRRMELNGERLIPASVDATWAALNDPEDAEGVHRRLRVARAHRRRRASRAVVAMKIGPVSARFKGNLKMTNVEAPNGYTINFDGQGGVAGFGRGSADVALTPDGAAATRLAYARARARSAARWRRSARA